MRILVTGGAGFIGSAVCRLLIGETDSTVVNIDKLTYAGNLSSVQAIAENPRYHFVHADICDEKTMESLFDEFRPDTVMHLAAESHVDRSISGSRSFIETNIVGTYTLLEVARRYWSGWPAGRLHRGACTTDMANQVDYVPGCGSSPLSRPTR